MIDLFESGEQENEPGLLQEGAYNLDCADNERDNCRDDIEATREG